MNSTTFTALPQGGLFLARVIHCGSTKARMDEWKFKPLMFRQHQQHLSPTTRPEDELADDHRWKKMEWLQLSIYFNLESFLDLFCRTFVESESRRSQMKRRRAFLRSNSVRHFKVTNNLVVVSREAMVEWTEHSLAAQMARVWFPPWWKVKIAKLLWVFQPLHTVKILIY